MPLRSPCNLFSNCITPRKKLWRASSNMGGDGPCCLVPWPDNHSFIEITTDIVAYVDAGVVLHKDWANHCVTAIRGQGIAAVSGPVDGRGIESCLELNTSAMLARTYCLKEIGPFPPIFRSCEGIDLVQRLLARGFHLASAHLAISHGVRTPFPFGDYAKNLWFAFKSFGNQCKNLTKALSWDGKVYFLNPALSLCVGERDTVAMNTSRNQTFFLDGFRDKTLRDFLYKGFIAPTLQGPLRSLIQNNILIEYCVNGRKR